MYSEAEEHRLAGSLHGDIKHEIAALCPPGHQRGTALRGDRLQYRVGRVRLRLVREVQTGLCLLEQALREDRDVEVRSQRLATRQVLLLRLAQHRTELALGVGPSP